jgi:hypothetical protein
MKIRKICKYEFEDETSETGTHDVEFPPSLGNPRVLEVWVDGVFIECLPEGEKASVARAWYYYEVRAAAPDEDAEGVLDENLAEVSLSAH